MEVVGGISVVALRATANAFGNINIELLGRVTKRAQGAPSRAVAIVSLHPSDLSPRGSDVLIRNLGL
jgi:hypothetical protein